MTEDRLFDEDVWDLEEDGDPVTLASIEPARFLWAADPDEVLTDDNAGRLAEVLESALTKADLPVAMRWLAHPRFLSDEEASERLERRLEAAQQGAGWFALAQALGALARRGRGHRASRALQALLERFWLDDEEARAVEEAATSFADTSLIAAMVGHEPWRADATRLARLAQSVDTPSLAVALDRCADDVSATDLGLLWWRLLVQREEDEALAAACATLSRQLDRPLGRAGGLDTVLGVQRVHGEAAVPALVGVFLSGAHRSPPGEAIERWLLSRPEAALTAALEELPDWMPRYEPTAMDRLTWRLLPRLDAAARERIHDLADVVGGPRGAMVIEELEALGG